jgi:hypothetical protein
MATIPKKATPHGFMPRAPAGAGPDLRDPKVLAEIPREVKRMAQHPENDAIDDWIGQVSDWESWK